MLHNNCSGKHAGFVTTARHLDITSEGHVQNSHPIQQRVTEAGAGNFIVKMGAEDVHVAIVPTWGLE
jgi:L-asparaginase II